MAQFEIELENGHKYQIDADTEEQAVMAAKGEDGGTTTAVGAFTRSAATGVVPAFGALGGAAIGQAVIPIPVVGALVGGLAGSVGANVLQRQALKIAAPETAQRLAELEQADVQQHPYASFAGRFVSPSPAFQIAPKAAIQGLRAIPAALRAGASEEVKKLATQGATQAGLAVGTSAVIPMMPESLGGAGRLPTLGEVAEGTAQMMFYGKGRRIRAPRLPLSEGEVKKTPGPGYPSDIDIGEIAGILEEQPTLSDVEQSAIKALRTRDIAAPIERPFVPEATQATPISDVFGTFRQVEASFPKRNVPPVVPATPPEPQRALTVLQEIRQANARTKEQIRQLFPQLSREQAAELRRVAWGESPPEPEKPKTDPSIAPMIMQALQAGDLKAVKRLAKQIETESSDVPESVFGLEKGVEDAIQERSPAPLPVEVSTGRGPEVGGQVRDAEALAQAQAQEVAPKPPEVQPDVRVKQLRDRIEAVRAPRMSQDELDRIFNKGDEQAKLGREKVEQEADQKAAELLKDVSDDDLVDLMGNDNRDDIFAGEEPSPLMANGAKDYAAIEWLRRRKAKQPDVRVETAVSTEISKPIAIPEIKSNPIGAVEGVPVYEGSEAYSELVSRFGLPNSIPKPVEGMVAKSPFSKNDVFFVDDETGQMVAYHRGPHGKQEPTPTQPNAPEAAPTAETAAPTAEVAPAKPATPATEGKVSRKLNPQAQAMKERAASRPPDIIDYVAANIGKIKPKSVGKPGSEGYYDSDYDELAKSSAGRALLDTGGQSPDEAVDALRRAGILGPNATVNDMWMAMNRARAARRSYFKGETPEAKEEKFWGAQKSLINQGKAQLVNVGDLAIGDKFTLKGEEMEIVAIDPDTGEVTVKNGKKFGAQTVPDGHEMPIDKGSLQKAPEEALPELKPETTAPPPLPTPKPKPTGELFGAEEMPFNLMGERATTAPAKPEAAQPELQQTEMFQVQKIVNLKDPLKSANAAQELYGAPADAAKKLRHQLAVMDSDPKVKKTFSKEQRAMLKEVLALLDQRAAKEPLGPTQGAGPGTPSAAQGPDPGAPIEQLTDSFKTSKAPLGERIKALVEGSYNLGEKLAQVKDAVARALSGLKTTGDALRKTIMGFDSVDDMLNAKGELSAELEKRGWRVRAFVQTVKRAIPDLRRRNAIAKWVDAGGDAATLQQGLAATKPAYRQAYQDALNLTGDDLIHAQNIQNYFEARLQEAINAGVLEHGIADYLHRIYPKDSAFKQRAMAYVQSGILSAHPSLARKRVFHFDWEAEQAGLQPVQDFMPRIAEYETSLSRAIAAREFIAKLTQMKAPDGRPIIGIKGVGVPIEDPVTGERTGTVIKPLGDFKKASNPNDPLNYRGDYKDKEYPALSKWKWVASDAAGKPIFLKGDVAIHPSYAGRIEALLEPSHVRYGRYPRLGQALLGISSTFKNTMLDISGFHHVQIALHAMEHRVMPWQIMKDIPFENPHVEGLLRGGVTLGGEYRESHLSEGLMGGTLTRHIPVVGPILEAYHSYLFQSLIPRIKMTMALDALERNRTRFAKDLASGKMKESDLYHLTANEANAAFGEQNYIILERSKTAQDMLRLIFLAPDFLEARGRFAGQAMTKYGTEQRMALALGAVTMYTLARFINKALDDQYHFEPENLFNVIYKGNSYGLRTVQGDILHLIEKPVQFWTSRLNPVYGRTAMEMATGRDWFGRKRSFPEQAWDTVSNIVPIAIRSNRERSMWESSLNAFGVTARRYNDVDDAFKLAQKWKTAQGVQERGEFIYDPDKDPLRSLKIALVRQDEAGAMKEIQKLVQSKSTTMYKLNQYFQRYAAMPFTGSRTNDRKFIASLSEDERKTVESGRQTKQRILKLFRVARNQYLASMRAGNR